MSFKKQMEKWTIELLKSELWVNNRQGSTAGELNLNESQRLHASWKNSISRACRHYPTPGRQRTMATSSSLPHGWRLKGQHKMIWKRRLVWLYEPLSMPSLMEMDITKESKSFTLHWFQKRRKMWRNKKSQSAVETKQEMSAVWES